jgi:hypothetical protein
MPMPVACFWVHAFAACLLAPAALSRSLPAPPSAARLAAASRTSSAVLKTDDAAKAALRGDPMSAGTIKVPQNAQCSNASMPLACEVSPTGNGFSTSSAFTVQGTTNHDDQREFLVNLGLTSNRGANETVRVGGCRPDKVTLYTGIVGEVGTGDIWSINPLLTQAAGSGSYNAQNIELDLNNENAHRGDVDDGGGLAAPVTYGISITGAGKYRSTAAICVAGQKGMWNRGIVFASDSIVQSAFQDLGASHQKSIDIRGTPVYGIYQASEETKNLFRGNTSHEGELRVRGPVVVERDSKERSVVLSAGASEEVASSGVAKLAANGTATVSVSDELCEEREHTYQLTAMGRPMRDLHIASELAAVAGGGCTFAIGGGGESGGSPGKVSWRIHSHRVVPMKSDDASAAPSLTAPI